MIIEKFITYDYSKIADWLIKTGVVLLAAALIVILGLIWLKVTAKKPGCRFGYRLSMVKDNNDAWLYVNRKIGGLWLRSGIVLGCVGAFVMLRCIHGYFEEYTAKCFGLLLLDVLVLTACHIYVRITAKKKYGPSKSANLGGD